MNAATAELINRLLATPNVALQVWLAGADRYLMVEQVILETAEEVASFLDDHVGFSAKAMKVSRKDYEDWMEAGGINQCSALTKGGRRCRNPISGTYQVGVREWLARAGEHCAVHGGEPSHRDGS